MPAASFMQNSFLGGEWSQTMQGRADRQDYRSAMNLCRNAIPVEEGAAVRRPGTKLAGITRNGARGKLVQFNFSQAAPYLMELTEGKARLYSGAGIVTEPFVLATAISSATPAVVTSVAHGYVTGDQIVFVLVGAPDTNYVTVAPLLGKQFSVTRLTADTYSVEDVILGPLDGSLVTLGAAVLHTHRIVEFTTDWSNVASGVTGSMLDVRSVQDEDELILFQKDYPTAVLTSLTPEENGEFATFSFGDATFLDGPYLDPPEDGTTVTPSATTGVITLTSTANSFLPGDPGRLIRLFSEPVDWDAATAYVAGDAVKYDDTYWTALSTTTGDIPGVDLEAWAIDPSAAAWTWGTITNYLFPTQVTVTLAAEDPQGIKAGGDLLYTNPIKVWRMGLYCNSNGYPTCGTFHEGRLWIAGRNANRVDSSMSNKTFDFSPTLKDGTVADNNAISATFRAEGINRPLWLTSNAIGIIVGTQAGEWLLRASQLNDPLTPTSIQASRPTAFGSENIEVLPLPLATAFVQRAGTKLIELTETYPPKYITGQQLSLPAKHLLSSGIEEIAYQAETTPIIWARTADGDLIGCTYRRDSQFSNQPVTFSGWHKHTLGTDRKVVSIQTGPSVGGDSDTLSLVTHDTEADLYYVELLTPVLGEDDSLLDAWFVDGAAIPAGADIITSETPHVIRFYGLEYMAGRTVTVWLAGLDLGDFFVESDGTIDVRLDGDNGNANPLLTLAYLNSISGGDFGYQTTIIPQPGAAGNDTTSPALADLFTLDADHNLAPIGSTALATSDWRAETDGNLYISTTWARTSEPRFGLYDNSIGEWIDAPTDDLRTAGYFAEASFDITLPDCYVPGTDFSVTFTGQMQGTNIGLQNIAWEAIQVEGSWMSDTPDRPYPNGVVRKLFNDSNPPSNKVMFPAFDTGNDVRTIAGYPIPGIGIAQVMQGGSWVTTGTATLSPGEQVSLHCRIGVSRDQEIVVPSPVSGHVVLEISSLYMRIKDVSAVVPYDCGGGNTLVVPACIGSTYTTSCQIVRPIAPQESGAANGPAFAKTRRAHEFGALLLNTQGISFGTDFTNMRPAEFRTPGGTAYAANALFSGTYEGTVEDDYSFDSMLCWSVSRPFPATVLSIGGFLKTQDR